MPDLSIAETQGVTHAREQKVSPQQQDPYYEFRDKIIARKKGTLARLPDGSTEFIAVDDETYENAKRAKEGKPTLDQLELSSQLRKVKEEMSKWDGASKSEKAKILMKLDRLKSRLQSDFIHQVKDASGKITDDPLTFAEGSVLKQTQLERVLLERTNFEQVYKLIKDLDKFYLEEQIGGKTRNRSGKEVVEYIDSHISKLGNILNELDSLPLTQLENVYFANVLSNSPEYRDTQNPQNLETIVVLMANSSDERYKEGGELALYYYDKNGKLEINFENVTLWIREKMIFWSDLNDDDPIQLYETIRFDTTFRSITFFELVAYDPDKYFRPQDGDSVKQTRYKRYQMGLIAMFTPLNHIHNFAVEHLLARSDKQKLQEHWTNLAQNKLWFNGRFLKGMNMLAAEDIELLLSGNWDPFNPTAGRLGNGMKDILAEYDSILELSNHNFSFVDHDLAVQRAKQYRDQAKRETDTERKNRLLALQDQEESKANAFLDMLGDGTEEPVRVKKPIGRVKGAQKVAHNEGDWVALTKKEYDEETKGRYSKDLTDLKNIRYLKRENNRFIEITEEEYLSSGFFVDTSDPEQHRYFKQVSVEDIENGRRGDYVLADVDQYKYVSTSGREIFCKEMVAEVLKYKFSVDRAFDNIIVGSIEEFPESASNPGNPAISDEDIRKVNGQIQFVKKPMSLREFAKKTHLSADQFFDALLTGNSAEAVQIRNILRTRNAGDRYMDIDAMQRGDYGKFLQDVLNMRDATGKSYEKWGSQETMNIYENYGKEPRTRRKLIRDALRKTVKAKYRLHEIDAGLAEEYMSLAPFFLLVAANNDTNQQGFDWPARLTHLTEFFESQAAHNFMGRPENWEIYTGLPTLLDAVNVMVDIEKSDGTIERRQITFNQYLRRKEQISGETLKIVRSEFSEEEMIDIIREPYMASIQFYEMITGSADVVDASQMVFGAAYNTGGNPVNTAEVAKMMKFTDFMRRLYDKKPYLYKNKTRRHRKSRDAQGKTIKGKFDFDTVPVEHAVFNDNVFTTKEGVEEKDKNGGVRADIAKLENPRRLARAAEASFHIATLRMYTNLQSGMPQWVGWLRLSYYKAGLMAIPMGYKEQVYYDKNTGTRRVELVPWGHRWTEKEIDFMFRAAGISIEKRMWGAVAGEGAGAGLDLIGEILSKFFKQLGSGK